MISKFHSTVLSRKRYSRAYLDQALANAQANISFSYKHKVMGIEEHRRFFRDGNTHLIAQ